MAALKSQFQIASEKGMSQAMFDLDFKVWGRMVVGLRLVGTGACTCWLHCSFPALGRNRRDGWRRARNTDSPLLLCSPHLAPQGKDWNGQLKYGTSNFYGANYFQSVTPRLSLGGEVFYLAEQRRRWGTAATRHGRHYCC